MALIFPRLANNFVKNGYFPTDSNTLGCIFSALDAAGSQVRVIDPCCGEGCALAETSTHLQSLGCAVSSFGIDVDADRAWHAKTVLDTVAHADVHDVMITQRSFGLLFLNPPYGDVLSDKAAIGDRGGKRERHEKVFCRRTFQLLQFGGVLVLIVPGYVIDTELATLIARNFDRVSVFMAPEQQFKQCVLFGVKRRSDTPDPKVVAMLEAFGRGENRTELLEHWSGEPYSVPTATPAEGFNFSVVRLDARQLGNELQSSLERASLWPKFEMTLACKARPVRRPLRDLSKWHLALALAAGHIAGIVRSDAGRVLLIKGGTFKEKDTAVEYEHLADGSVSETRILTDKFVPVIRAIDFTPGERLGEIVTIR